MFNGNMNPLGLKVPTTTNQHGISPQVSPASTVSEINIDCMHCNMIKTGLLTQTGLYCHKSRLDFGYNKKNCTTV